MVLRTRYIDRPGAKTVRIQFHQMSETVSNPYGQIPFLPDVMALPNGGYIPSLQWLLLLKAKHRLLEQTAAAPAPDYGTQDMVFLIGLIINANGKSRSATFSEEDREDLSKVLRDMGPGMRRVMKFL